MCSCQYVCKVNTYVGVLYVRTQVCIQVCQHTIHLREWNSTVLIFCPSNASVCYSVFYARLVFPHSSRTRKVLQYFGTNCNSRTENSLMTTPSWRGYAVVGMLASGAALTLVRFLVVCKRCVYSMCSRPFCSLSVNRHAKTQEQGGRHSVGARGSACARAWTPRLYNGAHHAAGCYVLPGNASRRLHLPRDQREQACLSPVQRRTCQ